MSFLNSYQDALCDSRDPSVSSCAMSHCAELVLNKRALVSLQGGLNPHPTWEIKKQRLRQG